MGRLVLHLAVVICLVTATAAFAGSESPSYPLGVVDTERVSGEYKAMQALNEQFIEFQQQQEAQLVRQQKSRMLWDDERIEYLDLCAPTAAPTAERDQRIAALEQLSNERSQRLLDLGQKKDRTPEEEQEHQKLDQVYKQRTQELNSLQADVRKSIQAKSEEFMRIITESFETAVKAVAEEKKLALVIRKEMVLHGGLDITSDVIAKLNAAPAPKVSMEAQPPATATPTRSQTEQPGAQAKPAGNAR